jgi:hypothetical protein
MEASTQTQEVKTYKIEDIEKDILSLKEYFTQMV